MPNARKMKVPIGRGAVDIRSGTLSEEDRTVEVSWASEAPVKRFSWANEEVFNEVLSIDPSNIRMGRFDNGMSLLDSHDGTSMSARLGTVVPGSVRFENGLGMAKIRFSRNNDAAEAVFRDLMDGHPVPISVGYRIHQYMRKAGKKRELPTYRATDWEPLELSAVPVPADPSAYSRSESTSEEFFECDVIEHRDHSTEHTMTTETTAPEAPAVQSRAEQERVAKIQSQAEFAQRTGLDKATCFDLASRAIEQGQSIEQFRNAVLESLVDAQERTAAFPVTQTHDHRERSQSRAMADALACRLAGQDPRTATDEEYRSIGIMQLARQCAMEADRSLPQHASSAEVVRSAMHTTSDFPILLQGIGERVLMQNYQTAPAKLKPLARIVEARDFRIQNTIWMDSSTKRGMGKVNEHGEFKRGTLSESGTTWSIGTYGQILSLTRQAIINDDLAAFERLGSVVANDIRSLEAEILVDLLTDETARTGDGRVLFDDAFHKNDATAAALSVDALGSARYLMRQQTDNAGKLIDVDPAVLVVPARLETIAEKILTQINADTTENVNPFSNLQLIVEPRLDAVSLTGWYLFARPAQAPVLQLGYLSGEVGPVIETERGFDIDGFHMKARLDLGGALVDWRGVVRNNGA